MYEKARLLWKEHMKTVDRTMPSTHPFRLKGPLNPNFGKVHDEEFRRKCSERKKGLPHSDIHKENLAKENKKRGEKLKGKICWMHNNQGKEKQVELRDVESYLNCGWVFGRPSASRVAWNKGKKMSFVNRNQSGSKNPNAKYIWHIKVYNEWFTGDCLSDLCEEYNISINSVRFKLRNPHKNTKTGVEEVIKEKK